MGAAKGHSNQEETKMKIWTSSKPARPGNYLWRQAAGENEYRVMVKFEWSPEVGVASMWLCYEITDFTEMSAGGEWKFVSESPVGYLMDSYVTSLVENKTVWFSEKPTAEGRYLWRESEAHVPVLTQLRDAVLLSTGKKERLLVSHAHYLPEQFASLTTAGQWAPVDVNQPW